METILYSKYQRMQEENSYEFFGSSSVVLNLNNLYQDIAMDIGCGPGNTSCKWISTVYPEIPQILALDTSYKMIELAKILNPNPKIQYYVVDITDNFAVGLWEDSINKIFSTFCLHLVKNQQRAFQNIFYLLKSGGEAAMLFILKSPFFDGYKEVISRPKWNEYVEGKDLEIPESHTRNFDTAHYRIMLQNLGFNVLLCEEKETSHAFKTEDYIDLCLEMCPLISSIPIHLHEEFGFDLAQWSKEKLGTNSKHHIFFHYSTLQLVVKKPNT